METIGYVVKTTDKKAIIDVKRSTACGDKCSSCGNSCSVPSVRVEAINKIGAKSGDFVEIQMETKTILKSAFIAYIIPLFMLIIGIISGINFGKFNDINNYEMVGLLFGIVFLFISFIILKAIDNKIKKSGKLNVYIIKILDM